LAWARSETTEPFPGGVLVEPPSSERSTAFAIACRPASLGCRWSPAS